MNKSDGIAKSTGTVSIATFASRILGLLREQVFAYLFGAGFTTDAFIAAFRIPNLLRDLFAEGALSSAFIPTFTKYLTDNEKEEAWRVASLVINLLMVVLSVVIISGMIFAPYVVKAIAPGFEKIAGKQELTTLLTQMMFPFLLLVALAAVCMGVLNSFGKFGVPAIAPTMLNLGMILSGFLICPFFHPPIVGMAIGALLGGLGQLLIQVPTLFRLGFKYKLILNIFHPGVKRILFLMAPAALGVASVQVNVFVSTLLASLLPSGSISYLNYSFRLMHLPLGVFGVAVATTTLPVLSVFAAKKDYKSLTDTCSSSVKLVFFLTIPCAVFLALSSKPIISLLYQHGQFSFADTVNTSGALIFYCVGLFAYASSRVLVPAFYSVGNAKTPVTIGILAVALNIGLNLMLMGPMGFKGLAFGTSVSAIFNMLFLLYALDKTVCAINKRDLIGSFSKILLASVFMGMCLSLFLSASSCNLQVANLLQKAILVVLAGIVCLGSYFLACYFLKIGELERFLEMVRIRKQS